MDASFPQQLKIGQRIKGRVVEIQAGGQLLVSFQGRLIRVVNGADRLFKVDELLDLQVASVKPLEFKIYQRTISFDRMI